MRKKINYSLSKCSVGTYCYVIDQFSNIVYYTNINSLNILLPLRIKNMGKLSSPFFDDNIPFSSLLKLKYTLQYIVLTKLGLNNIVMTNFK